MKRRPSRQWLVTYLSTLFRVMAHSRLVKQSGLRSLACTKTRFFPAGIAKGPTPAITSQNSLAFLKFVYNTLVLGLKPGIPINFAEIELKTRIRMS